MGTEGCQLHPPQGPCLLTSSCERGSWHHLSFQRPQSRIGEHRAGREGTGRARQRDMTGDTGVGPWTLLEMSGLTRVLFMRPETTQMFKNKEMATVGCLVDGYV